MFCIKCGKPLQEQAKFCPYCGYQIADDVRQVIKSHQAGEQEAETETRTESERRPAQETDRTTVTSIRKPSPEPMTSSGDDASGQSDGKGPKGLIIGLIVVLIAALIVIAVMLSRGRNTSDTAQAETESRLMAAILVIWDQELPEDVSSDAILRATVTQVGYNYDDYAVDYYYAPDAGAAAGYVETYEERTLACVICPTAYAEEISDVLIETGQEDIGVEIIDEEAFGNIISAAEISDGEEGGDIVSEETADEGDDSEASQEIEAQAGENGTLNPGDHIYFGSYEMDGDTENGSEAIEWRVLEVQDGQALILSEYGLDYYYEGWSATLTWESSGTRTWLNDTFYNEAFDDGEKAAILITQVTADANPEDSGRGQGSDTEDLVFLLSSVQADTYFTSDEDRQVQLSDNILSQVEFYGDVQDCSWWYLRTTGSNADFCRVMGDGAIDNYGYGVGDVVIALRPAMWIDTGLLDQ